MTPQLSEFDLLAEAYPVHARREVPRARSPKRASPRFASRRNKAINIGGMHQRCQKRSGV